MAELQKELQTAFHNLHITICNFDATLKQLVNYLAKKDDVFDKSIEALRNSLQKTQKDINKIAFDLAMKSDREAVKNAFSLANNQLKIVMGGFYAGFFLIWAGLKGHLENDFMTKAGALLAISLAVYALTVVFYSYFAVYNLKKRKKYLQSESATYEGSKNLQEEIVAVQDRFDTLNEVLFFFTLSTAIGALAFLIRAIF